MKYVLSLFTSFIAIFFSNVVYADLVMSQCDASIGNGTTCASPGVLIFAPGSSTTSFAPPSTNLSIGQLQITYSVKLDASNPPTGFTYNADNWGVIFVGTTSSPTYYKGGSLPSGVKMKVDASKIRQASTVYVGTVVVTIDFTGANNLLTSDITSLIANNSLQLQPYYYNGSSTNLTSASLKFYWQADKGAMLNAPTLAVAAQDSAFVVNLSPPSSLNAAYVNNGKLSATTNALSGYVVVYWLDTDASGNSTGCKANPGGWQFPTNPVALNTTSAGSPLTCTYTAYQSSFNTGGTSSVFGCPAKPSIISFDGSTITSPNLTSDQAAIPYTPGITNPTSLPSDSNGLPVGCYNVVYVPSSQSSWSKGNINNGEIYGVVAWALNYNVDGNSNLSPNYSLAHSNISYITGISIPLASLDKNPDLPKTTSDCFVVTSASESPNSQAVFYWRILRDEYLTPLGITPFYYRHAKTWAHLLDEHPKFKPALNFIFEKSGKFLYHAGNLIKNTSEKIKSFLSKLDSILSQEAAAQELPSEQTQEKYHQPKYDVFITGGVLFPTDDKKYYDKYYSSQETIHVEGGANYIFWFDNLGVSTGLLGRYIMNTTDGSVTVLGTEQQFTRNFYSITAEGIVGLRYRNPCWSYLQPGIFAGVGVTRFREEASTSNNSSSSTGGSGNKAVGVTQYSPTYEFGANLDINLVPLFSMTPGDLGNFMRDILLRTSVSYNINPTLALSSTGVFVQAGFVFLLD